MYYIYVFLRLISTNLDAVLVLYITSLETKQLRILLQSLKPTSILYKILMSLNSLFDCSENEPVNLEILK